MSWYRRGLPSLGSAILFLVLACPATAGTVRIDPPSGRSFAEPDLALDPTNSQRLVVPVIETALAHKHRVTRERDAITSYSSADGGASFLRNPVAPNRYLDTPSLIVDPVVAFNRLGTAFLAALVDRGSRHDSIVGVQRSLDGGRTFQAPVVVVRHRRGGFTREGPLNLVSDDKPWLAIDRTGGPRDGTVYVAWSEFVHRRSEQEGVIVVARSTDGGRSFSRAVRISSRKAQAVAAQAVVQPNGTLQVLWTTGPEGKRNGRLSMLQTSSGDGGRSFTVPSAVAPPYKPASCRTCDLPVVETSASGALVACWLPVKGGTAKATCARSADGHTWSPPGRVAPGVAGSQEILSIAPGGGERFWLSFYSYERKQTAFRLFRSDDGGTSFQQHAVLAQRPYSPEEFLGDYTGLDTAGGQVFSSYVFPRGGRGSKPSLYITSLPAP